jgi:hypothetical protein
MVITEVDVFKSNDVLFMILFQVIPHSQTVTLSKQNMSVSHKFCQQTTAKLHCSAQQMVL